MWECQLPGMKKFIGLRRFAISAVFFGEYKGLFIRSWLETSLGASDSGEYARPFTMLPETELWFKTVFSGLSDLVFKISFKMKLVWCKVSLGNWDTAVDSLIFCATNSSMMIESGSFMAHTCKYLHWISCTFSLVLASIFGSTHQARWGRWCTWNWQERSLNSFTCNSHSITSLLWISRRLRRKWSQWILRWVTTNRSCIQKAMCRIPSLSMCHQLVNCDGLSAKM